MKSAGTWREEFYDRQHEAASQREVFELLGMARDARPRNENERALRAYYAIADQFVDTLTGQIPQEGRVAYSDARDAFLVGLPDVQREYVRNNLHPNATPLLEFVRT